MGNVHALAHRVTALSMACLSSTGLILAILAGLNCSFLAISAEPDRNLITPDGVELASIDVVQAGVLCDESEFYDPDDRMWNLSQMFFYVSTALGGATTMLAWTISTCWPPTVRNWRALSIVAAITAVLEIPIFLIFEIESCNMDITRQQCSLDLGSYFLIASVAMWVVVTLWTQFLDPPRWSDEINAWVVTTSKRTSEGLDLDGTDGSTHREGSPLSQQSDAARNAFFATVRNNDDLTVWPLGADDQPLADGDDDDDISSVSDASGGGRDLEKGKNRGDNTTKQGRPTTDPNDAAIRKGAASVIASLQTSSEPTTKERAASPKGANTGNDQRPNSRKKKEMRNNALMDSDNSNLTGPIVGPKIRLTTIVCPDVTQQQDNAIAQLSSCFVNKAELPSRDEYFGRDIPLNQCVASPAETKSTVPPSQQQQAPTVVGAKEVRNEQASIAASKQSSPEAKSVGTLSILEDLANTTPLPEADMQA
jgi:hypothetical protein